MGTETRIGIATGLVIVIVASVYFFYGSERPDDQLLVATGSTAVESPKIPKTESTGAKPAAARPQSLTSGAPAGKHTRPAPTRQPRLSSLPNVNKTTPAPQTPAIVTSPTPNSTSLVQQPPTNKVGNGGTLSSPPVQSVVQANRPSATPSTISNPSPTAPVSTALRGNSSQMLVEATKKNLDGTSQPPALSLSDSSKDRTDGDVIDTDSSLSMDRPALHNNLLADASHPKTSISLPSSLSPSPVTPGSSTSDLHVVGENVRHPKYTPTNVATNASPAHTPVKEKTVIADESPLPEAVKPLVETWPKKHTVQTGDTLVAISEKYYGTIMHADDILKANSQIKSAKALKIGDVLSLPSVDSFTAANKANAVTPADVATTPVVSKTDMHKTDLHAAETTKVSTPSANYTVQAGDTFSSIAAKKLGDKNRWKELFDLNRKVVKGNAKLLRPGMTLALPK